MNELHESLYRAVASRDRRFEGSFVVAVETTGVYCRPGCPARTPRRENVRFYRSGAAAERAGFRACRRCRPDRSEPLPTPARVVARVLRLIDEGALEEASVEELAARVGMGARHLRRLLVSQVGSPPRALKRARPARRLRLRSRAPYDWASLAGFLATRAVPGLESLEEGVYRRAVAFGEARGVIEVRPQAGGAAFELCAPKALQRHLMPIVERVRRLFDLDADPAVIDAHLRRDRRLARRVAARPGLRVPGAWDPFELGVRAILGQQISVRGATTLAGRLVAAYGEPSGDASLPRLFPRPEALASARLESIGLPRGRAEALRAFAAGGTLDGVRGVGPWTRAYVAMRSGDPDAFPAADLGVLRALGVDTPAEAERRAAPWRPWRAYAVLHLWMEPC